MRVVPQGTARRAVVDYRSGESPAGSRNPETKPPFVFVGEPPANFSDGSFVASQSGSFLKAAKLSLAASWQ